MASSGVDYYSILGIPRTANSDDIQRAYLELKKRIEAGTSDSPRVAGLLDEVRATLIDPEQRRAYDAEIGESAGAAEMDERPQVPPVSEMPQRGTVPGYFHEPAVRPNLRERVSVTSSPGPGWVPVHVLPHGYRSPRSFVPIAALTLFALLVAMGADVVTWHHGKAGFQNLVSGGLVACASIFVILRIVGRRVPRPIAVGTVMCAGLLALAVVGSIGAGDVLDAIMRGLLLCGLLNVHAQGPRFHASRR